MKTTHTQGEWTVERTSSNEGDFQGRILCNSSERKSHESDYEKPQVYIIVGESSKRNGYANIHFEANAKLMAAAPELLEACKEALRMYESAQPAGGWQGVEDDLINAIKKATT